MVFDDGGIAARGERGVVVYDDNIVLHFVLSLRVVMLVCRECVNRSRRSVIWPSTSKISNCGLQMTSS